MTADDLDKLLTIALFHSRSSCHASTSNAGSEYRNNMLGILVDCARTQEPWKQDRRTGRSCNAFPRRSGSRAWPMLLASDDSRLITKQMLLINGGLIW